ncbi:MAG: fatty acid--CoA ligase family protein, partial [Acidobacteriota bacterium]
IYTSGTSGNPKGVVLSHLNMLADAKAIAGWFQFSAETRALCILPLFHNNGQITTLLAPLYAGGSTVIVKGKASLMSLWGLAEQYGVTFTSVMASILSILLNIPTERKDTTLRAILCGGQVLTRSVQEAFEARFGVPVFEGYGLTETTSFSCINDYPADRRRHGSIGRALPVNDMAILDENDQPVPAEVEGEICIRGYNVAVEYLGLPERNRTSFANDWFHSGDYGHQDADGFFYFHGRRDFLIIKGGENIYGAELENVIFKHEGVAECAVIGIPDALLGEDICAFVKRKDGASVDAQELKEFCRGKIAAYKQAKRIVMIDDLPDLPEIPKGPTKKVLYRVLKDYYRINLEHNAQKGSA